MDPLHRLWLFFIVVSLQPVLQQRLPTQRRQRQLASISRKPGATHSASAQQSKSKERG